MRTVFKNLRSGPRAVLRSLGFTVVAALIISAGIGVNTAIFNVAGDPPGATIERSTENDAPSPANYHDWRRPNHLFGDLAAVVDLMTVNLTGTGQPEELPAGIVTADFFQLIGVKPIMGRAFLPEEDTRGHDHVVILSHRLWSRRFGRDGGMVGKSIELNGESHRVVGVLPPDFSWNNRRTDVWLPYAADDLSRNYRAASNRPGSHPEI